MNLTQKVYVVSGSLTGVFGFLGIGLGLFNNDKFLLSLGLSAIIVTLVILSYIEQEYIKDRITELETKQVKQ